MSTSENRLFPCPVCGVGRGEVEATCKGCGWSPNSITASDTATNTPKPIPRPTEFAAAFLGFVYLSPASILLFLATVFGIAAVSDKNVEDGFSFIIFAAFPIAATLIVFLLGHSINYLTRGDVVEPEKKLLWIIVLGVANVFAFPFFWHECLWKPTKLPTENENSDSYRVSIGYKLLTGLFCLVNFSYIFLLVPNAFAYGWLPTEPLHLIIIHFTMTASIWITLGVFIAHLFNTKSIKPSIKPWWLIGLFIASILLMPIYWFLFIFRHSNPERRMVQTEAPNVISENVSN